MILNLSEITKSKNFQRTINTEYESKPIYFEGDKYEFIKPVKVEGTVALNEGIIELNLRVSTELRLLCSRCLEPFSYPLNVDVNERMSMTDTEDEEVIVIDSDNIDITKILENSIVMAVPTKKLCKEDCKGLCQKCGANLNVSPCNCLKEDVDIRFAGLKDLFFTE